MSSGINIKLSTIRKPTKRQLETVDFIKNFVKKNKRQPTLLEIAKHFKISIPSAWEMVLRCQKNMDVCAYCGNNLKN